MDKVYTRIVWQNQPSTATALGATNLNKMDYAINTIDDRVVAMDTSKADQSIVNSVVQSITYDESTGVLTITKVNGTSTNIDTKLEKLAVNFTFDAATQQLIIALDDGTTQSVDLSALITQYEFLDSDVVTFEVDSNGKIKADIINGSVTADKLQPNFLADVIVQANIAVTNANLSKRYAVGGVESGDETDNAKYYMEQARIAKEGAVEIAGFDPTTKIDKTSITQSTTDNDPTKVPSSAVTYAQQQAIMQNNLYLASGFSQDTGETTNLWTSSDGINWRHFGNVYKPPTDMARDSSICKYNGDYYIVYSAGWDKNYFGVAKSQDLINWSFITNVSVGSAYDYAWAPEIFVDDDNSFHVFVTCSLTGTSTFKLCELHPTNTEFTTWSAVTQLTGNFASNVIDAYMVKKDGLYCVWYKNETTKYLEYATSTSLLTGYIVQKTGDWAGWGANIEGACLIKIPDNKWRIYFDAYEDGKCFYSESSDNWNTWTVKQELNSDINIRHCTVISNNDTMKDVLQAKTNNSFKLVDLAPLATDHVISKLNLQKNTIYYVERDNYVTILDMDLTMIDIGDQVRFCVFSALAESFIDIKNSSNVIVTTDYKICSDTNSNENIVIFEKVKAFTDELHLRPITPNFSTKFNLGGYLQNNAGIIMLDGVNLNDVKQTNMYHCFINCLNMPADYGWLLVMGAADTFCTQLFISVDNTLYTRVLANGTWTDWVKYIASVDLDGSTIADNANSLVVVGTYTVTTLTLNLPTPTFGIIEVKCGNFGNWIFQTLYSTSGDIYKRRKINLDNWTNWEQIK